MNKEEFINEITKLDINYTEEKLENLKKYFELLKIWNEKFNLTRIIEEKDVYLKHFYDSLCLVKAINLNDYNNILDIGTGAGFPGIVLAIFFNDLKVTLLESNGKKCLFLNEVKTKLNLQNIEVINQRAEEFSKLNREKYDLITCRAVSHLNTLIEIGTPSLKVNGLFLPLKAEINDELKESKEKMNDMNLELKNIISYTLPIENSTRTIPIIKKLSKTKDIYPREYNKIIKDLKKDKK